MLRPVAFFTVLVAGAIAVSSSPAAAAPAAIARSSSPTGAGVTFYDGSGCSGAGFRLLAGQEHHRLSKVPGDWNDRISSVRLDADTRVFIFVHKDFGKSPGRLEAVGGSLCADLRQAKMSSGHTWDNEISSLIVARHPYAFRNRTVVIQSFLMSEHCLRWEPSGSVSFHFCTNAARLWAGGKAPADIVKREAFRVVPPLDGSGDPIAVSYEALDRPGFYLVTEGGNLALRARRSDRSFLQRASFRVSPGKAFVQWFSIGQNGAYLSARRNPPFFRSMANNKEVRKEITFNFLPYAPPPELAVQEAARNLARMARSETAPLARAGGWRDYCQAYRSAACRFAPARATRVDGAVFVSGLLMGPKGRWGHIATLPEGMRPAYRRTFHLNRYTRSARVDVLPDGRILWAGGERGDWISLDGIVFAAAVQAGGQGAPTLAHMGPPLQLAPGWSSRPVPRPGVISVRIGDEAPAAAESVGATVLVGGLVKGPCRYQSMRFPPRRRTQALCGRFNFHMPHVRPPPVRKVKPWSQIANGRLATLPAGLRPAHRLIFNLSHNAQTSRVDVLPNGEIRWVNGRPACGWVSLDGIAFSLDPGTPLQLGPGWRPYGQGYGPPVAIREGKRVLVSGLVTGPRRANGLVATLPPGMRPAHQLVFSVNQDADIARIDVHPDGRILWTAGPTNHSWLPLDGVRFVVP